MIALAPPGPDGTAGAQQTGISLQTNGIDTYHAQLTAAGVDVDTEISRLGGPCRRCSGCTTTRPTCCWSSRSPDQGLPLGQ